MKFPAKRRTKPQIHLTALIDMVFLLLIFFLLSSNFVEQQGVAVSVPEIESESVELLPELRVNIDEDGFIFFNGVQVNDAILEKMLEQHLQLATKKHVAIKADRRVIYDRVVQVIDIAKAAGAKEFLLVTQPPLPK